MEIWKGIPGIEERYEVSSIGRVRSLPATLIKKNGVIQRRKGVVYRQSINPSGYYFINITLINKVLRVHRLVAVTFIPNPDNLPFVNHIDGDKLNNKVENLEWCTPLHNVKHAFSLGLIPPALQGQDSHASRYTNDDVYGMRRMREDGCTYEQIANEYKMSTPNAYYILNKKRWKNLA